MEIGKLVRSYLRALEKGNTKKIVDMFSKKGIVHSPLTGKVKRVNSTKISLIRQKNPKLSYWMSSKAKMEVELEQAILYTFGN